MKRQLALTTATLTLALALAPPAGAGDYTVKACFNDGSVGNGAWAGSISSGHTAAYTNCPGEGIVVRNSGGPEWAPKFAGGRQTFTAPPGTRITRLWGDFRVNAREGWYAGFIDDSERWIWCGPNCSTFGAYSDQTNIWLDTSHIRADVVCVRDGGCPRSSDWGVLAMRNVSVTINDPTPPDLAITGGSVAAGGWQRGRQTVQVAASDVTGISSLEVRLSDKVVRRDTELCNWSQVRPCLDKAAMTEIPIEAFGSDGRHTLTVAVRDAASNTSQIQRVVQVDNTAPGQVLNAITGGADEWRSTNGFAVSWRNPAQTASPIIAARYSLCRIDGDPRSCVEGLARGAGISAIPDVRVPRAGEWRMSLWLEDGAGNADRERAVNVGTLRLDDDEPVVSFAAQDPNDPTRVRVIASDRTSGVSDGRIEARRQGEDAWRSLATARESNGFSAVLDDSELPKGHYELRARVVDQAGNERSTQVQTNGDPALRTLPLRIGTRLAVGRPTRLRARNSKGKWRTRTVLRVKPRARYGKTIPLRGRLTMPGANPLAGADIEVWERVKTPMATWRQVSQVRTSRTGGFRFKALRGPSRTLRFRYPGTATIRSRTAEVDLGVRATTSFRVSRDRVVNGEEVRFVGRLKGRTLGETGKLLHLQVFTRGRWSTFATPRANRLSGRWSHPYRFSATRGLVRYRFRVLIPREATFPYETGTSKSVRVVVRGL